MLTEKINGVVVPYNKSIEELRKMLCTGNMSEFVVACEALSYKSDKKAFELLKSYITHNDKYKRLCILKTIFRHPMAEQEKDFLEESILSDDILFAENGLKVVCDYKIKISDQVILTAVFKHLQNIYCTSLYVLQCLDKTEENYAKLVELFKQSKVSGQKEVLGDVLCKKYLPEKSKELFDLFSVDSFAKIRLLAVKIGKENNNDISALCKDANGHVKKEVERILNDK